MKLPRLVPERGTQTSATDCVALVVYAPFGTDETLSTYPDGESQTLAQHPLYLGLLHISSQGVHVTALIDRVDDDTWLVEIEAGHPQNVKVTSQWKENMDSPRCLAGLLRRAHQTHPSAAMVLALEGHGAGFLPEVDRSKLTLANITDNGRIEWRLGAAAGNPALPTGVPLLPTGVPLLPTGCPLLPTGCPLLPSNHMPLSTWGLGEALRLAGEAGVPKLSVIHFDNCFNMSVEVLHTVAPYAEYATGYPNYNFFTAGAGYPTVFGKLQQVGSATPGQMAQWFAEANHQVLVAKQHHPTAGCTVRLSRLHDIANGIDDLADALLAALRGAATVAERQGVVEKIRKAIVQAQQYDTEAGFTLDTPDELTDIYSLASSLLKYDFRPHPVHAACRALQDSLKGIKLYGDNDIPWVGYDQTPPPRWNFSSPQLAMNIFLPDPLLIGHWDWRSPYYLDVNPDPTKPLVQPHIIDFVKVTDWVDFLIEYHRDVKFVGLLAAEIPELPVFRPKFVAPKGRDEGCSKTHVPGYCKCRHRHGD
jgi:hypothetical protein